MEREGQDYMHIESHEQQGGITAGVINISGELREQDE